MGWKFVVLVLGVLLPGMAGVVLLDIFVNSGDAGGFAMGVGIALGGVLYYRYQYDVETANRAAAAECERKVYATTREAEETAE